MSQATILQTFQMFQVSRVSGCFIVPPFVGDRFLEAGLFCCFFFNLFCSFDSILAASDKTTHSVVALPTIGFPLLSAAALSSSLPLPSWTPPSVPPSPSSCSPRATLCRSHVTGVPFSAEEGCSQPSPARLSTWTDPTSSAPALQPVVRHGMSPGSLTPAAAPTCM